ncbi:hypothetical protein M406DRAFT_100943 [Cryphonectria parasitica EP155]|uniref:Uncharacterized protein n=1 Tax=Cryphonectria parasitica (strain ATCC 38755 / EP155) TaxID=660469 RepID=A0A9P4YC37_CRYP1|nr:uncharacterized protein M406DRAFT_100943 [Cryphonectria parasitica EP155]KAF3770626.1 hypothetical protein M406DRAFT_100943 [Cryphonectria parasitica EP155]
MGLMDGNDESVARVASCQTTQTVYHCNATFFSPSASLSLSSAFSIFLFLSVLFYFLLHSLPLMVEQEGQPSRVQQMVRLPSPQKALTI